MATLYTLTRSLAATVVFNNMMAIIGFVLYDLSLPGSDILGLALDGVAIVVAIAIVGVVRKGRTKSAAGAG